MKRLVLYQFWRSTASWRVRWALAVKGVPFDIVSIDLLAGEQHSEPHIDRSPLGTVPVLEVENRFLSESVAIIHYLEELEPEPQLLPKDPWARARTLQIMELVNAGIQPMQSPAVRDHHSPSEGERSAWVRHFTGRGLAACEKLLRTVAFESRTDGPFAMGDRLTAADLFLVPQVAHARRFGVNLDQFHRLIRAEEAALATEHALSVRPERQPGAPSL